MTTKDEREPFLARWSRMKQESREEPADKPPAKADEPKPAPELPPVDELNYDSDFKAFMDKGVDSRLRRLALKKLFSDPRFNVTDGLDDYAEDYSVLEDLPEEMAALQQHARRILRGPETEEKRETEGTTTAQPDEPVPDQVAARSEEQPEPANRGQSKGNEDAAPREPEDKNERHT